MNTCYNITPYLSYKFTVNVFSEEIYNDLSETSTLGCYITMPDAQRFIQPKVILHTGNSLSQFKKKRKLFLQPHRLRHTEHSMPQLRSSIMERHRKRKKLFIYCVFY